LGIATARGRPVATAETRLLEVPAVLADLFPEEGIRRGSTVVIDPAPGGYSLALALAAAVTTGGRWAAALGLPSLGLVAAAEMGVRLERLALVPDPGEQWATVTAALIDGFDLLLLRTPPRVKPADARRLVARVREKGAVMAVLGSDWPEAPDIRLAVTRSAWTGLEAGHGSLQARQMDVVLTGRRAAARERRRSVWMPGPPPVVLVG
jgi:hypothetical protein